MSKKKTTSNGGTSGGPFNIELLDAMTRLMRENDLNTLEVRDGAKRIVLKRGAVIAHAAPVVSGAAAPIAAPAATTPVAATAPASGPATDTSLVEIKSPLVGTVYLQSKPGDPPYVRVGDHVDADTVVCQVEAMKVYNDVKAETSGTIVKVVVQDATPVQFGSVLFLVKPD